MLSSHSCGCSSSADKEQSAETVAEDSIERDDTNYYDVLDSMPDGNCVRIKLNPLGGTLARVFNDSNYVQLEAAQQIGITPVSTLKDVWKINQPIRKVETCKEYYIDNLSYSMPYLVPEADELLKEIGARFNDSLAARGGGNYRLKVTSILRSNSTVSRLRRRNGNAVEASAHMFGTTFDISYVKFICDSVTVARTQEDLKNLLAEVLKQLREEEKCYVKYERKQGCFHITARPNKEKK
jgi:uncharacterized protein YcbK (DUF882 family)